MNMKTLDPTVGAEKVREITGMEEIRDILAKHNDSIMMIANRLSALNVKLNGCSVPCAVDEVDAPPRPGLRGQFLDLTDLLSSTICNIDNDLAEIEIVI